MPQFKRAHMSDASRQHGIESGIRFDAHLKGLTLYTHIFTHPAPVPYSFPEHELWKEVPLQLSYISHITAGSTDTSMMANMAAILTTPVLTTGSCIRKTLS